MRRALTRLLLVILGGAALAQPAAPRKVTVWKTRYENTVWRLLDDGGSAPVVSGHLLTVDRNYTLQPARFDYRDHTLRTVAVGGGETQRVEIRYLRQEGDHIVARIGGREVIFTVDVLATQREAERE